VLQHPLPRRDSLADWISTLEMEAQTRWNNQRKLLLLSQIPSFLRSQGVEIDQVLAGRPLMLALRYDGADRLALVQNPFHSAVWAALPKAIADAADPQNLFTRKIEAPISSENNSPSRVRFKPWFWAAFIKALEPDHKRWLTPDHFVDQPHAEVPPANAILLDTEYIANLNPEDIPNILMITNTIEKWAKSNGIELSPFELRDSESSGRESKKTSLSFESLDQDDLRRIVIPLDIVFKLLKKL
jgi:hypothetical protein